MNKKTILIAGMVVAVLAAFAYFQRATAEQNPAPNSGPDAELKSPSGKVEVATFAGGCFWGTQDKFDKTKGVLRTFAGYTGGSLKNPTYEDVCTHTTGHAEAVQVEFDPAAVSYQQLVELFWNMHDPTQANGQGPDIGDNYRSAIFYHSPEQKAQAEASKAKLQPKLTSPIVTQIVPAGEFYKAEDYHQHYFKRRGILFPVCH